MAFASVRSAGSSARTLPSDVRRVTILPRSGLPASRAHLTRRRGPSCTDELHISGLAVTWPSPFGRSTMKKLVIAVIGAALVAAPLAFAQKKSLVVGMGSADAGKLDPHIASTTPDKGLLQLDVQRPRAHQARHDQPGVHRARSRRELDVESGRHRMDVQDPPRRAVPSRLRRVHRRGRRLLDQAREQQGDVVVLERLLRRSTRSRRSTSTR